MLFTKNCIFYNCLLLSNLSIQHPSIPPHQLKIKSTQQHFFPFFPDPPLLSLSIALFSRTLTFPFFSSNSDSSTLFFLPCFSNSLHAKFNDSFISCPVFALTSKYVKLYSPAFCLASSSPTCLSSKSHLFPSNTMMLFSLMFWLHRSIHSGKLLKLFSSALKHNYC